MNFNRRRRGRKWRGSAIAEFGPAIMIVVPLIVALIYWSIQGVRAYMIECTLKQAATIAARRLALAYGANPQSVMDNPNQVLNSIRIGNTVTDTGQFTIPAGGWRVMSNPATVTVIVSFTGGDGQAAPFPDPDPFHIGPITFSAQATQQLE